MVISEIIKEHRDMNNISDITSDAILARVKKSGCLEITANFIGEPT